MLEDRFGDIIRKARMGLALAVDGVARAGGMSPRELLAYENCESRPAERHCQALAGVLGLDAAALWRIAAGAYMPEPPVHPQVEVAMLEVTAMSANACLAGIAQFRQAFLVDPGGDAPALMAMAKERGWEIVGIVVTHGHRDHLGALPDLVSRLDVPVFAHPKEYSGTNAVPLAGDDELVTAGMTVQALACPGHTPHGYSFLIRGVLFTGDTLFAGSLGRAASSQAYGALLNSARRLLRLPANTAIYPGHGPPTTVLQELRNNPFLARSR